MAFILVLGAGSDIARALAREYAREGNDLYLAGRDPEALERDAADHRVRFGVQARAVRFDASDYASHGPFYGALIPPPSGVVCAFGYLGSQEKGQADFGEAERILSAGYIGCVSILGIVASDLDARGQGFIVGISSVAGDRGRAANYLYGSAKAGFTAFLSGLRNRLHGRGVRVLTVKPGFVRTKMTAHMRLPALLTAEPADVARDILKAQKQGRDVVYTPRIWAVLMAAIVHIPERVFKRMKI